MNKFSRRQFFVTAIFLVASVVTTSAAIGAETDKPRIGVIGAGRVGTALGGAWIKAGYEVMFSSRTLEDDQALADQLGPSAYAGTPREAAAFGDVLLVSVPLTALPDIGETLGDLLDGKIVIDTSNAYERRDGELATEALEKGIAVFDAEMLPGARLVRAFNAIGFPTMGSAIDNPGRLGMPIAGADDEAVEVAKTLISDIGFVPVVVGDWESANLLRSGGPFSGELSPEQIREIVDSLK